MKLIALNEFDYQGVRVTPGVFDGSEADMISMSHFGKVRPATSTEVEESQIECAVIPNNRQKAYRKR